MVEATAQVFATTELLEAVLLQLPPKNIMPLQRVRKEWQATVQGSVKLQRYIFFRTIDKVVDNQQSSFFLNPMLKPIGHYLVYERCAKVWPPEPLRSKNDPLFYPEASWRRMYLSQPPFRKLMLRSPALGSSQGTTWREVTRAQINLAGLTLEDLYQAYEGLLPYSDSPDLDDAVGSLRELEAYEQMEEMVTLR